MTGTMIPQYFQAPLNPALAEAARNGVGEVGRGR